MTTLEIKPRWADKTARFKGTVAAGEVVAVTVKGAADWINEDALRLRIVNERGDTVAQFPVPDEVYDAETMPANTWGTDGDENEDATCQLSLNTDQMRRCVPRGTRMLLFVLDDPTQGNGILYFKDLCEVTHWPDRTGEDSPAPIDLGNYRNFLREAQDAMDDAARRVETAETQITASATAASAAATAASQAQIAAQGAADAIPAQVEAAIDNADIPGKVEEEVADQLDYKQDALDETQMAAVDSGITEEILDAIQDDIEDLQSGKADAATVTAALAQKANASDMETALANKASNSALSVEVAARASADSTLNAKITTLIGTDDNMSARSIAQQEVAKIVASADADFDTLKEVADWIKSDTTGAAKMQSDISDLKTGKVDKVTGKGLSTEDYTTVEKQKLAGVEAGANNYTLPPASASTLGGVKVGNNLSIDANGVLSATGGGGGGSVTIDDALDFSSENPVQNKIVTMWFIRTLLRLNVWKVVKTEVATGTVVETAVLAPSSSHEYSWDEGSGTGYRLIYYLQDGDDPPEWVLYDRNSQTPMRDTVSVERADYLTFSDTAHAWTLTRSLSLKTMLDGLASTSDVTAALALKADATSLPYAFVGMQLSAWMYSWPEGAGSATFEAEYSNGAWIFSNPDNLPISVTAAEDAMSLTFTASDVNGISYTVTATRGYQLTDRAINAVSLSAAATLTMPAAIAGHARDLVVRLSVGAADLNITWGTADAGGVAVDYETEDGKFPDLSAAGTYLVRLTETAAFAAGTGGAADVPAKFLIQCQPLQTAAAGGAA